MKRYTTVLSIAGSDSIGGAGIQADIKMGCSMGVNVMTAITAVTAQNTQGVKDFLAIPKALLEEQLKAVCTDVIPDAVKVGMLPDRESVEATVEAIEKFGLKNIVVDPVMVATSGDALSDGKSSRDALIETLLPLATVITPNLPEAAMILGHPVSEDIPREMTRLAEITGAKAIMLKGGHNLRDDMSDYLWTEDTGETIKIGSYGKVETLNTHGTGCSLSTCIASLLALGESVESACRKAKKVVYDKILKGAEFEFGHGHGPIYPFLTN